MIILTLIHHEYTQASMNNFRGEGVEWLRTMGDGSKYLAQLQR
jgi:hypothetical protein